MSGEAGKLESSSLLPSRNVTRVAWVLLAPYALPSAPDPAQTRCVSRSTMDRWAGAGVRIGQRHQPIADHADAGQPRECMRQQPMGPGGRLLQPVQQRPSLEPPPGCPRPVPETRCGSRRRAAQSPDQPTQFTHCTPQQAGVGGPATTLQGRRCNPSNEVSRSVARCRCQQLPIPSLSADKTRPPVTVRRGRDRHRGGCRFHQQELRSWT
jgi:hypothetical protein